MKKFYLSFLIIIGLCLVCPAQKNVSKPHALQSGKWYVTGAIDGKTITLNPQQQSNSEWEAKFSPAGNMHHCSTLKTAMVDATGVEIKPGTFYCDTLVAYKIKNNVISINSNQSNYYYKITSTDKGGYVLIPTTVSEFK
jgi:hypothetical protein